MYNYNVNDWYFSHKIFMQNKLHVIGNLVTTLPWQDTGYQFLSMIVNMGSTFCIKSMIFNNHRFSAKTGI